MLVLFETPAGFALFKVLDEGKLSKVEVIIFLHAFLRFVENGKLPWLDFSCRKFSVNLFFCLGRFFYEDWVFLIFNC